MKKVLVFVLLLTTMTTIFGCQTLKAVGVDTDRAAVVVAEQYVPKAREVVKAIQTDYDFMLALLQKDPMNNAVKDYFVVADTLLATFGTFIASWDQNKKVTLTVAEVENLLNLFKKVTELRNKVVVK